MNRDHEDWDVRKKTRDLPGHIKSVQIRHLKVQQNHVRRILGYSLNSLATSPRFVADLPAALLFQERAQVVAYRRIVVYHKNSNQTALPFDFSCGTQIYWH